jgi:hypothetical protein
MRRLLVLTAAAVALAACGGDDEQQAAKRKVDKTPHVEGKWRAVYTPIPQDTLDEEPPGEEQRATWRVTPKCSEGACSFVAKSTASDVPLVFRYDEALKDYTLRDKYKINCVGQQGFGDEVLAKDAYTVTTRATYSVAEVVQTKDGRRYATELAGQRTETQVATEEAGRRLRAGRRQRGHGPRGARRPTRWQAGHPEGRRAQGGVTLGARGLESSAFRILVSYAFHHESTARSPPPLRRRRPAGPEADLQADHPRRQGTCGCREGMACRDPRGA